MRIRRRKHRQLTRIDAEYSVYNQILQYLYKTTNVIRANEMGKIALENQTIKHTDIPFFVFKGVWYYSEDIIPNRHYINRLPKKDITLDISLIQKVEKVLKNSFDELKAINFIKGFIAGAVNLCKSIDCLAELLPEIDEIDISGLADCYNTGEVLTEKEKEEFLNKYSAQLKELQGLRMLNLVLIK